MNKPNFSSHFGGPFYEFSAPVSINHMGFRQASVLPVEKPVIVMVGDSTTAGFEVDEDKTFTALLQKTFPDYVFINAGVRAYDTHMVMAQYKAIIQYLNPRLIIYTVTSNDFPENLNSMAYPNIVKRFGRSRIDQDGNIMLLAPDKTMQHYLDFRVWVADNFQVTTALIALVQYSYAVLTASPQSPDNTIIDAQAHEMTRLLRLWDALLNQNKTKLVILKFPEFNSGYAHTTLLPETITYDSILQDSVLPMTSIRYWPVQQSVATAYQNNPDRPPFRFQRDGHATAEGHTQMAAAIASFLGPVLAANP